MSGDDFRFIDGSVTAPRGFRAAGVRCGIKKERLDLALLASDVPARGAGTFTRNRLPAAPVLHSRAKLEGGLARAIFINSGIANAGTGPAGLEDADRMAALAAAGLGIPESQVLVFSTGLIGPRLPLELMERALPELVGNLGPDPENLAARAIMTTDSRPKFAAVEFELSGRTCRIGGMAKGAGMIAPDMATMLAFLTSDADVRLPFLRRTLRRAVDDTFNLISVDGCMSTNDSVIVMANGLAENKSPASGSRDEAVFAGALAALCRYLARAIVTDGEGATKVIRIAVTGAPDRRRAARLAHQVADSNLVKTAFFGSDINWGRILAALGAAGIDLTPEFISINIGDIPIAAGGLERKFDREKVAAAMSREEVAVDIVVGDGPGEAQVLTTDLSYDYVRINAEYHT